VSTLTVLRDWMTEAGLRAIVLVGPASINGYVEVPTGHPWHGKSYSECLCGHEGCWEHSPEAIIDVHGGITFSGRLTGVAAVSGHLFGFDTAHCDDDPKYGGTYKDEDYVAAECERLAAQLANPPKVEAS
jgi:hypothetical protein